MEDWETEMKQKQRILSATRDRYTEHRFSRTETTEWNWKKMMMNKKRIYIFYELNIEKVTHKQPRLTDRTENENLEKRNDK